MVRIAPLVLAGLTLVPAAGAAQGSAFPALDELVARASADSNAPEAHYALAMGYWRAKHWDDAEREIDLAIRIEPAYAEAYLSRSNLFLARGEKFWRKELKKEGADSLRAGIRDAMRDWHRAFMLDPMVDLAAIGPVEINQTPRLTADQMAFLGLRIVWWLKPLTASVNAMMAGRYADAQQQLRALIDDPRMGGIYSTPDVVVFYHGLASAHSGDYRAAIDDFSTIRLRIDRQIVNWRGPSVGLSSNELTYLIATAALRGGYPAEALTGFHQAVEHDFTLYMAHAQLATLLSSAGHWDEAITEMKAALDINPDDSSLLVALGRIYQRADHPAEAADAFDQAARINPRDALADLLLGQALEKGGHPDEAKTAYTRFLAIAPSSYATQCAELKSRLGL